MHARVLGFFGWLVLGGSAITACSGSSIGNPEAAGDDPMSPSATAPEDGADDAPGPNEEDPLQGEDDPPGVGTNPGGPPSGTNTSEPGGPEPTIPGAEPTTPPSGTSTSPDDPTQPGPSVAAAEFAPRIRRMTNAEFEATVQTLLGTTIATAAGFVPDARQAGFTRNAEQIVDPLFARQLQETADELAAEYVSTQLAAALPCAANGDESCARSFFEEFLPTAFRRPIEAADVDALMTVFGVGAEESFEVGMRLAISASLQSAAFLYHTELGDAASASEPTQLNAAETAASMAYLLTGHPPDETLLAAAADGTLQTADGRAAEARRLLQTPEARAQVVALVEQWLGVDALRNMAKDSAQHGNFEALRPHMLAETADFITEVAFNDGGSLQTLLSADYTVANSEMIAFYGLQGQPGKVSLEGSGRRGILNHASFLARYAKEAESSPIARGVVVARRVMCRPLPNPVGLEDALVPPPPDPSLTTRERFSQHVVEDCAGCHAGIDAVGFTFENFDAIGTRRDTDNNKPVETATELPTDWAVDLPQTALADSSELATLLSQSDDVHACFTRHLAKYAGAAENAGVENYFLANWQQLEAAQRGNILEVLVSFVASDVFVQRTPGGAQ